MQLQVQMPLETIQEAANLYNRYQAGSGFRAYLKDRSNPVTVLCMLMLLTSVALTAGTIVSLGASKYLVLLVLLLAPFLLVGSVFVQALFYFGWLENRALAKGLRHGLEREGPVKRWIRKNLQAEMGKFPSVPWLFGALFIVAPLVLIARVSPAVAAGVVVAHVAAFILFARLDR